MSIGQLIRRYWTHPLAQSLSLEESESIVAHRHLIRGKALLRASYLRWYRQFLPAYRETRHLTGEIVELGSGAGFFEELVPEVQKTDSIPNPFAHKVMDAQRLDYGDNQLRAIFMAAVLHHVPLPALCLKEAERCLKPGGRFVLIEPNNNALERFLCKYLNHYEYFDDTVADWKNTSSGRMENANLALPWVIFVRDRQRFEREFPRLRIKSIRYHTFIAYFVSGGMTFKAFLPSWLGWTVNFVEWMMQPIMRHCGTMMTVDLEKV